ncbi:MAG: laminin B domain-containing protein [Haloarculaceae archaeon]
MATATVPSSQPAVEGLAIGTSETGAAHVFNADGSGENGSVAITSSFDADDDGWRVTGDAQGVGSTPEYLESGGNSGGHICANDDVEGGTWYFSAPAEFLGDRASAYSETLEFDIKQSSTNNQFAQDDIVLRNETRTIVYDFGDASAHPGTNWTSYSVPLDASNANWTFDSGGNVSSAAFRTLLSNLTDLSIRGEYVDGSDRGCLDTVRLSQSSSSTMFDVSLDATNSPVTEGETLTVDATIENTGDQAGVQDVVLSSDNTVLDSTEVVLEAGQRRTVTLSWVTGDGDAANHNVTVATDTDATTRLVAVNEPAEFAVTLDATNSPVTEGETLTVDATIENTGSDSGTQEVALSIGDFETDSVQVSLDPGQRRTVSLSWTTSGGDAGTYRGSVRSAAASDSTFVAIQADRAGITFDNQQVADNSVQEVVVGSASVPSSGFLVVYNASVGTNPDPGSIVGVSGVFASGEHENVRITLDERIVGSQTLTVVAHNDTNRNNVFDGAGIDTPFTVNGVAVNDAASITIRSPTEPSTVTSTPTPTPTPVTTPTPTATPSPTPTATPTPTEGTSRPETTGEGGPGFGVGATILALLSATLLARRNLG